MLPRILIIGNGRHGKDTLAEIWRDMFGLKFESSSMAAARIFLYDKLKDEFGYQSFEECYNDRINRRQRWYEEICAYNAEDPTRLTKEILEENECYVGMRNPIEVLKCIELGIFDLIVWVDASERVKLEDRRSISISSDYADIVIENNGTLQDLKHRAAVLGRLIFAKAPIELAEMHDYTPIIRK